MRFTTTNQLPPTLHPTTLEEVLQTFEILDDGIEKGSLLGFDTETSGLESDGLDVTCHFVCLATSDLRTAIPVSGEHEFLMPVVAEYLRKTQHLHCGFNIIYDWNVLYGYTKNQLGWEKPLDLHTCYADASTLINRFDEEGEETFRGRSLKDRARFYLGMVMADFDWILKEGGVMEAVRKEYDRAMDYCTRDGYVHLALTVVAEQISSRLPWCERCPSCSEYMFTTCKNTGKYECVNCGPQLGEALTIFDWHKELDIPSTLR